jgi:hypothetical protein
MFALAGAVAAAAAVAVATGLLRRVTRVWPFVHGRDDQSLPHDVPGSEDGTRPPRGPGR